MALPCPHCGSDESFSDRETSDFRPIVPPELQGDFTEPPRFKSDPSSTPITDIPSKTVEKPPKRPPIPKEPSGAPSSPTKSIDKPIVRPPFSKESSDTSSPSNKVMSSKSDDVQFSGPPISGEPPKTPASLKSPPLKEARNISHVVESMVSKTEETGYRTFVKNHLLEIETAIQSMQTDIQALLKGQAVIESMLKTKEEEEDKEKSKGKKKRWRK